MKIRVQVLLVALAIAEAGYSQNVNWRSLSESRPNAVQFHVGYDFGATARMVYSRHFTLITPVVVGLDCSLPMGEVLLDDFKVRLGGQAEVVRIGGFSAAIRILSNFRRYQTGLVRIVSFGSDFGFLAGYYRPAWYGAGECGFDKAIATNLKHSDIMKESFPAIRDGWYVPTGGQFYFGVQGGATVGDLLDLSLRLGVTEAQFDDEDAVLPYYAQLGLGVRF